MILWENSCTGCTAMGLPCRGSSCPNHDDYPVLKCDHCGETVDALFETDGGQFCEECLLEQFTMITAEDLT